MEAAKRISIFIGNVRPVLSNAEEEAEGSVEDGGSQLVRNLVPLNS
jgi:hypothetical protein